MQKLIKHAITCLLAGLILFSSAACSNPALEAFMKIPMNKGYVLTSSTYRVEESHNAYYTNASAIYDNKSRSLNARLDSAAKKLDVGLDGEIKTEKIIVVGKQAYVLAGAREYYVAPGDTYHKTVVKSRFYVATATAPYFDDFKFIYQTAVLSGDRDMPLAKVGNYVYLRNNDLALFFDVDSDVLTTENVTFDQPTTSKRTEDFNADFVAYSYPYSDGDDNYAKVIAFDRDMNRYEYVVDSTSEYSLAFAHLFGDWLCYGKPYESDDPWSNYSYKYGTRFIEAINLFTGARADENLLTELYDKCTAAYKPHSDGRLNYDGTTYSIEIKSDGYSENSIVFSDETGQKRGEITFDFLLNHSPEFVKLNDISGYRQNFDRVFVRGGEVFFIVIKERSAFMSRDLITAAFKFDISTTAVTYLGAASQMYIVDVIKI